MASFSLPVYHVLEIDPDAELTDSLGRLVKVLDTVMALRELM